MKRAFEVKQKAFFINFKGLPVAKNCLRPECAPLRSLEFTGICLIDSAVSTWFPKKLIVFGNQQIDFIAFPINELSMSLGELLK